MAKSIIDAMTAPFEPEKYHDEYRKKLEVTIEQKIAGKEIVAPKEKSENNAATLMEALQPRKKTVNTISGSGRMNGLKSKLCKTKICTFVDINPMRTAWLKI